MRYFFNLASDYHTIPDEIGTEVANLQSAIAEARKAIKELADELPAAIGDWHGWRLEITDEKGSVVETILLDEHKHS